MCSHCVTPIADSAKADPAVLAEELARLDLSTDGPLSAQIVRLANWYDDNGDPEEQVTCDQCGGVSDTTNWPTHCPYCGDDELYGADEDLLDAIDDEIETPEPRVLSFGLGRLRVSVAWGL